MQTLLTPEFLEQFPEQPEHMTELGAFVAYRTYARWLEGEGRRETWKEIARRSVEYNMSIGVDEMEKNGYPIKYDQVQQEAETLFSNIFNLKQFLSGRTHWVGGADTSVADKFPLANFNCSFVDITKWEDMCDMFYLLLVGTGVGFRGSKEAVSKLPPINTEFELINQPYNQIPPEGRQDHTSVRYEHVKQVEVANPPVTDAEIIVGDSKEGWVLALNHFFTLITSETINTISINYDNVRPKGERLKTFGGTASGHEPLKKMFENIRKVLRNELDPSLKPLERINDKMAKVRPIHILDIGNLIGHNVIVGGVRRTAEIFLGDADDWEVILAKYGINGIWDIDQHKNVLDKLEAMDVLRDHEWLTELGANNPDVRPLHHRRMSNNSVAFETKPSREMLNLLFTIMQSEGEPGFVNLEEANRRRPNAKGLNPCAEILLDSYGVCNLTTVNVKSFVNDGVLDFSGLAEAQALSTRAGVRMTCLDLELKHWDEVHKRDRLIGPSLTGWQDAMSLLGYDEEQEAQLLNVLEQIATDEVMRYSALLRIPVSLLSTTVKPEGTLSQVAGGVSPGIHHSHSPYYIRRIRINAQDPLAKVAANLGWNVAAEVGTNDKITDEELRKAVQIEEADTLVIEFPVESGASKTKDDVYIDEQFDTYFRFQNHYTQHNTSNTIHVRPDEWERAEERVWDGWDDFVGVSFLAYDGGSYTLAPYESITEEEYHEMKNNMVPFKPEYLHAYETGILDGDIQDDACTTGACPAR